MKKKLIRLSLALAAVLFLFAGCGKESFDEELLYGTWDATDGFYYTFNQDHTGVSGDNEGSLPFTWELDFDELHMRFTGRGQANKSAHLVYVIDKLTSKKMEAYDQDDYEEETVYFTKR